MGTREQLPCIACCHITNDPWMFGEVGPFCKACSDVVCDSVTGNDYNGTTPEQVAELRTALEEVVAASVIEGEVEDMKYCQASCYHRMLKIAAAASGKGAE